MLSIELIWWWETNYVAFLVEFARVVAECASIGSSEPNPLCGPAWGPWRSLLDLPFGRCDVVWMWVRVPITRTLRRTLRRDSEFERVFFLIIFTEDALLGSGSGLHA